MDMYSFESPFLVDVAKAKLITRRNIQNLSVLDAEIPTVSEKYHEIYQCMGTVFRIFRGLLWISMDCWMVSELVLVYFSETLQDHELQEFLNAQWLMSPAAARSSWGK